MDLDAYVAAHADEWVELESLMKQQHLDPAQADRLIELYQRVGTHLSVLRSTSPDPTLVLALSSLLARARRRTAQVRVPTWSDVVLFFTDTFPGALYRMRWFWISTALACLALIAAVAMQLVLHPELESVLATPERINELVNVGFEEYYHASVAQEFALSVWVNNALLAAICVALGVLGFPIAYFLFDNCVNVGIWAGIMINHDKAWYFFGLLLPHGLLELTAVFVAGGAGFRLFWSWVAPGNRTRLASMAHEGRSTLTIAMGVAVVLGISGIIEGFITPSPLPPVPRVMIGAVAWVAFLFYALVLGRKAYLRGADGDVSVADRGEDVIAAG